MGCTLRLFGRLSRAPTVCKSAYPSAHRDSQDMQDGLRSQTLPFLPRLQHPVWLGLTLLCHRQPT